MEACDAKGFTKANAMFFYTDAELQIPDPNKKYNDLTYIGVFDWNI
ncbi:MAG: immunity 22 family protein [Fibrella sp.]|nr:immunity 22 family protein [Armatimonadota bacterium]